MKIEVLGTGCAKCERLEKDVYNALAELDIAAEVSKVKDIKKMMDYKVMLTPALVINGKVKASGGVPKMQDLKKYIQEEL
ncbi:MAG: thioredoxin family protein [Syntrophomonadaceae bacterium]|nr:thioredoxin family protein [Syntrophomonadaceae bacterium]